LTEYNKNKNDVALQQKENESCLETIRAIENTNKENYERIFEEK
jgi:hypothetical protein